MSVPMSARPDHTRRPAGPAPLPLRPATARLVLARLAESEREPDDHRSEPDLVAPAAAEIDPGWQLAASRLRQSGPLSPAGLVAETTWWPTLDGPAAEAVETLWRHSVAVMLAARRIAREAGDTDPDRVGRAGLLANLGYWSIAADRPDLLARLLAMANPAERHALEVLELGKDAPSIGLALADRLSCDSLVADAAWLASDERGSLNSGASDALRLSWIQEAHARANQTPWTLAPQARNGAGPTDVRVRLLIAEVQVRCSGNLVADDSSRREEDLSRRHVALTLKHRRLAHDLAAKDRFLDALTSSDPADSPANWAAQAGRLWCEEPGVASARVSWSPESLTPSANPRPPLVVPLSADGQGAEVHLWPEDPADAARLLRHPTLEAWRAWAGRVSDRDRLARRLDAVVHSHRSHLGDETRSKQSDHLGALAEFAAGASHEMNNPLAVILGRAQLLLAATRDADTAKSLRAIIGQAQRAHHILRDLMHVARPAEPRPRSCQPAEIINGCLRDLQHEAQARDIRIQSENRDAGPAAWVDPDPLRQVADALVRNALEASPKGSSISVTTERSLAGLRWTVHDEGRGLSATDASHLFDPFYCGRQAGRGLGLGLPRAARYLERAGGHLAWHSSPGQGTTFVATLPLSPVVRPLPLGEAGPPPSPG
ncbi:ATP-binding protein [Isosphaeraceae bacterium EP7]